jgi:coenzyme F420-reducing hydrogenase delta subunit
MTTTPNGRMVVFGCECSAGVARDELGAAGGVWSDVEWVDLPCGGALDGLYLLKAFESGAHRVLVLICQEAACRSIDGNRRAAARVDAARALLQEAGIEGWRLACEPVSPTMAADVARIVESFRGYAPPEESTAEATSSADAASSV